MEEEEAKAVFESFATTLKELHKNKHIVVQN